MTTPIDAAAAVAQFAGLAFQAFQGCIDGYKFCYTAQHIGRDGDFLRSKLLIEWLRLEQWAKKAGLDSAKKDFRLNWEMIQWILKEQETLLTSAEKLRKRYGLDVQEEELSPDASTVKSTTSTSGDTTLSKVSDSGIERFITRLRPSIVKSAARPIQKRNGPIKRIRWAAFGKERTSKIINDIGVLNTQLEQQLEAAGQDFLRESIEYLLQDVLSACTNAPETASVKRLLHPSSSRNAAAIDAAARVKQIRLILDMDKRDDEIATKRSGTPPESMPVLRVLRERKLKLEVPTQYRGIGLARYDDRPVLVEWKIAEGPNFTALQVQMQSLAVLLSSAQDRSFHCLPCVGLLQLDRRERYGIVYEVPSEISNGANSMVETNSLFELILERPRASLIDRIRIAQNMAEAILQLHTAGWLHKGVRSENVRFVAPVDTKPEAMLQGKAYLVGYEYARPGDAAANTERPDTTLLADLYCHPEKRTLTKTSYQKRFDMYALGCLLVELALWEHLVNVFSRQDERDWKATITEAEAKGKDLSLPSLIDVVQTPRFCGEILHHVGPSYLEAIKLCVTRDTSSMNDQEASVDVQRTVLEMLRSCRF